ncbi:MAG: winged helix DNA-binding domain-containing protein [Acidobacteria bacterium]|nr:winged helix DNA-binding domain-containing protein [Acidobacteriota bacterium]MCA1652113.1 winged helix DNA-binding domain-containing protein [Acidobacteriota bacterium]
MRDVDLNISRRRLRNQKLTGSRFRKPEDVVAWLGAMQAQDYAAAKWAIGLRANAVTEADVERAFNAGTILRTHVLRPTWHFVTPADIRWMLALTAPRVHAVNGYYYRKFELDAGTFARSRAALERALQGGKQLTRPELAFILQRAGIPADGLRLGYLMMHAELDAVICSGRRRGNQSTYALLEERVPFATTLQRDEALAELTRRYFSSHGPATVRDYVWWSGLTAREAKAGLEMVRPVVAQRTIGQRTFWFAGSRPPPPRASTTYLLPNYDELLIAYRDRGPAAGSPRVNPVSLEPSRINRDLDAPRPSEYAHNLKRLSGASRLNVACVRRSDCPIVHGYARRVCGVPRSYSQVFSRF